MKTWNNHSPPKSGRVKRLWDWFIEQRGEPDEISLLYFGPERDTPRYRVSYYEDGDYWVYDLFDILKGSLEDASEEGERDYVFRRKP